MKLDLIIISVVMVLLVFFPFYLLPLMQLRGNKKISQLFRKEAEKLDLNPDIKESWNLNMIGLDSQTQKLLVIQNHEEVKIHHYDLKEVKHIELLISQIPVVKNGKTENILKCIDFEFTYYTSEEKEILNMYDYDLNTYQDLEVKNAEKLFKHLKGLVMAHPVIKRTA